MHLEHILNIERQERARVPLELHIDMNLQFLIQMFLIDDEVAVDCGFLEFENGRCDEEYEKTDGGD